MCAYLWTCLWYPLNGLFDNYNVFACGVVFLITVRLVGLNLHNPLLSGEMCQL